MKFLKIGPGEGKKVLIFFVLAALIQAGVVLGVSVADGLFLTKIGVEKLPQVFLAMPLVMIIAVPIFDYFLNSLGINRILSFTFFLLVLGGMSFAGWLHIKDSEDVFLVVYFLKLYSYLWFIITYTLYWNFVGEYFYLLDAKRLYPLLSGGLTFGGVFGGGLVAYYGLLLPPSFFLVAWSVLAVLAAVVFFFIVKNYRKTTDDDFNELKYNLKAFASNLKFIVNSRFAILINLVFFAGIILAALAEYQYSGVFSKNKSEEELISFFGLMFALASGLNFFINFFVFSRLVYWIGVRNVSLIYPCVIAVVFGVFALYESTQTAFLLFFAVQSILISIDFNNWNFIYKAFTSSLQKTVRFFTEGIVDPFATCLAGAFLIASSIMDFSSTQISIVALGVSSLHIFSAFALKNNYLGAVVEALKGEGFKLSKNLMSVVKEKGLTKSDLILTKKAILDADEKEVVFYFNVLRHYDIKVAVETTLERFENKTIKNDKIFKFLFELVFSKEKNYDLIKIIVAWVKQNYDRVPFCLINQLVLHNYINYQEIPFRNQKTINSLQKAHLISRWISSPEVEDSLEVLDELNNMLASNKEEDILNAVEILGYIGESKYLDLLEDYIDHPSTAIREQAIKSVEKIANVTSDKILPKLIQRLPFEGKQTQLSLLNSVSYIKDSGASRQLMQLSDLLSPRERRQIFETVCGFGLRAVPVVISTLNDNNSSLITKSLASRVLAHLAFPQFESLAPKIIDSQINKAYDLLIMKSVLVDHKKNNPNIFLLARFYENIEEEEVDYVLEILTLSGQMPDFELLRSSLRSENLQVKGNAIEALEQGIPREVFRKLLPLIDSRSNKEKVDFYLEKIASKSESKQKKRINFDQIIQTTLSGDYLTGASIALQILWERDNDRFSEEVEKILQGINKQDNSMRDNKKITVLIEVINSLFERKDKKEKKDGFNIVERLAVMVQNSFWKDSKVEPLLPIAQAAIEVGANQIVTKEKEDDFSYMVISGKASVKIDNTIEQVSIGDSIGKKKYFFEKINWAINDEENIRLLKFNKQSLLQLAESSSEVGLLILKDMARYGNV